ncbi:MAG: response regulator transcription factor [Chitinophagaceae bacterium]|jgi:two-component system LytT family response regulator|nr:response regulator transcription factor [Chitinophagaceae bacterium]
MRILIVEDEKPASQKLQKALQKCSVRAEVVACTSSIRETVQWLHDNASPDLVFMDIQLSDGVSFRIFDQIQISCPVIFVTAYDEYWQTAFEHNSIDYLLKPVKHEKLEAALAKFEKLKQYFSTHLRQLQQWQQQPQGAQYKKRFLIKRGADYISVKTEELAYFYATHKLVCLVDTKGQKYILDESLADIERQLDPMQFFRINRKYLVNQSAIRRIRSYPKSKLQLDLEPTVSEEVIISQENVAGFKQWMGQ